MTVAKQIEEIIFGEYERLLRDRDLAELRSNLDKIQDLEDITIAAHEKTLDYPGIIELSENEAERYGISRDETAYIIPIGKEKYIALVAARLYSEFIAGKMFDWKQY